jgi:hypothetical protein
MKTTLANFLCQIISNFIRVGIFIFTRFGGQKIYFLCIVVRNPDRHDIYFNFFDKANLVLVSDGQHIFDSEGRGLIALELNMLTIGN